MIAHDAGASASTTPATGELCVMFELGAFVCAVATRGVRRLMLVDDARAIPAPPRGGTAGEWLVVDAAGQKLAGRDLGDLLEVPAPGAAWILVDIERPGGVIPVALRTGACLVVDRIASLEPLPPGLFRARGAAFPAAFRLTGIAARGMPSGVGLFLDPAGLFTSEELAAASAVLSAGARGQETARSAP